jgi:hypothetical protein
MAAVREAYEQEIVTFCKHSLLFISNLGHEEVNDGITARAHRAKKYGLDWDRFDE